MGNDGVPFFIVKGPIN